MNVVTLFFIASSCCSIGAISSYWHLTERKLERAIFRFLQAKSDQSNEVKDPG